MQWTHHYAVCFRDTRPPQAVRFDIEKRIRMLLKIEPETRPLVYADTYRSSYNGIFGRIELRFEAPSYYSFHFEAARSKDFMGHLPPTRQSKFAGVGLLDERSFLADSEKAFNAWTSNLPVANLPGPGGSPGGEDYERLVREAVEWDAAQAAASEDQNAIAAVQQGVLDALRAGKQFRSSSKEGMLAIRMNGGTLLRQEWGEQESSDRYTTQPEMLTFLRNYFDFEACSDTVPHKPPELEIWKFIAGKFS